MAISWPRYRSSRTTQTKPSNSTADKTSAATKYIICSLFQSSLNALVTRCHRCPGFLSEGDESSLVIRWVGNVLFGDVPMLITPGPDGMGVLHTPGASSKAPQLHWATTSSSQPS